MGKLYDRKDMEFELQLLDQTEQELSGKILRGEFDPLRSKQATELIDKQRSRCRMNLLRSGQLMRDLRYALSVFNRCPSCFTDAEKKRRPCPQHKVLVKKASSAVYWAGLDNAPLRAAQGRPEDGEDFAHDGACNEWEQWYFRDLREKVWPGQTQDERDYNKNEYGSIDYRGWLAMLLENEELSYAAYQSELARLRA